MTEETRARAEYLARVLVSARGNALMGFIAPMLADELRELVGDGIAIPEHDGSDGFYAALAPLAIERSADGKPVIWLDEPWVRSR
jgi:hypothetical protein